RPRPRQFPTRSVTNFSSAHDTHANLLIEQVLPQHRRGRSGTKNSDSRLELPCGKRDVDDAAGPRQAATTAGRLWTPHRRKEGEVNVPHDANFIFSEVNACVKRYVSADNGETWIEAHSETQTRRSRPPSRRARELARQAGNERLPPPRVSPDGQEAPVWRLRHACLPGRQLPASVFGQDASVEVAVKNLKRQGQGGLLLLLSGAQEQRRQGPQGAQRGECSLTDTENRVQTLDHVIGILYPDLAYQATLSRELKRLPPSRFASIGPVQITLVASFSSKQVTGVFQQASFYVDYY
uniref:Arrestin_N domain-containing protein n=1 Tax=Macrostomum lignano TaxID=282301 RepID=A0A1I8F4D1_9PLAT